MCKENVNSWKSYILTYIKSYFMFDKTFRHKYCHLKTMMLTLVSSSS